MPRNLLKTVRLALFASVYFVCACAPSTEVQPCNPPVGSEPLLQEEGVIIIGDYHGTNEPPEVFYGLACAYLDAHQDEPITIALELPDSMNAIFKDQVTPEAAIAALRKDPFWARFGDGRHSASMLLMTERLLRLVGDSNGRVRLLAIERPNIDSAGAEFLSNSLSVHGAARALVFLGNAHARRKQMPAQRSAPMGQALQNLGHRVISLDIRPGGGEAWLCSGPTACGRKVLPDRNGGDERRIEFNRCEGDHCAFDGFYYVPKLTVSDPV